MQYLFQFEAKKLFNFASKDIPNNSSQNIDKTFAKENLFKSDE